MEGEAHKGQFKESFKSVLKVKVLSIQAFYSRNPITQKLTDSKLKKKIKQKTFDKLKEPILQALLAWGTLEAKQT